MSREPYPDDDPVDGLILPRDFREGRSRITGRDDLHRAIIFLSEAITI